MAMSLPGDIREGARRCRSVDRRRRRRARCVRRSGRPARMRGRGPNASGGIAGDREMAQARHGRGSPPWACTCRRGLRPPCSLQSRLRFARLCWCRSMPLCSGRKRTCQNGNGTQFTDRLFGQQVALRRDCTGSPGSVGNAQSGTVWARRQLTRTLGNGRVLQWPDRGGAAITPRPFGRGSGSHAAPL